MAQVLALTFKAKDGARFSGRHGRPAWPAWVPLALLGFLAFLVFASLPGEAQAACVVGPLGTITCTDNQTGGVDYHNPPDPYTTVDVNTLSTDITPASGAPGIRLIGQGANPGSAGCHVTATGCQGNVGDHGGAAPPVTINFDGSVGPHAIETTGDAAGGIVGISYGGHGANGGNGAGLGGSGGVGGPGAVGGVVTIDSTGGITTHGNKANAILALSVGGGGGIGGDFTGADANAGDGGPAAGGGTVHVTSHSNIMTFGNDANGIVAQSTGGRGGAAGDAGGLWSDSGGGGTAAPGGAVTVDNFGNISTNGAFSVGILAQSIGGFGGDGGSGGGLIAFGGDAGSAGPGVAVIINNSGTIETNKNGSHGIFAQSIGGGGGTGGDIGGVVALGASGGIGGAGGTVTVTNNGTGHITTSGVNAKGIYAQSVGGGGGDGGNSGGILALGGSGSATSGSALVKVTNSQQITTGGDRSDAIYAQSIGGGGGNGGLGAGFIAIGGAGGGGGDGGDVDVNNSNTLNASGMFSRGIFAQSIGGGGGDGGLSVGLLSFGGSGAKGGAGHHVSVENSGNITTNGSNSSGIFAQSVGGGGGDGGDGIGGGVFGAVAFGGSGGAGGNGGNVDINHISTPLGQTDINATGDRSNGILAQSVGGGGGDGGFAIAASGAPFVSAAAAFGGKGGSAGNAGDVWVGDNGTIETNGSFANGIVAEAIGGGGGRGGFAISAAGSSGVALTASFGAKGGKGGTGGQVTVNSSVGITTGCSTCTQSNGIFASSIGGGGGTGGFAITASGAPISGLGSSFGGDGGEGNFGKTVSVTNTGAISTMGSFSNGIMAQSIGGGGGNAGFAASGTFSMDGVNSSFTFGGDGGKGSYADTVTVDQTGKITTAGDFSNGIFAQSVGGGGGTGGFAASAGFSLSGGSTSTSYGGDGGEGSDGGEVIAHYNGDIKTSGNFANGIFAQSVGGGGGTGGFSLGASATLEQPSVTNTVGGDGGDGGISKKVTVNNVFGTITTTGEQSNGIVAQSISGGGGTGGFSIGLGFSLNSDTVNNSVGGDGGSSKPAGDVEVVSNAVIDTGGVDGKGVGSYGILAQSISGGGGLGGFSGTGDFSFKGDAKGYSTGGMGGTACVDPSGSVVCAAGTVSVTSNGAITTRADNSIGIFAQSVGGGGGVGGFSIAAGGSFKGDTSTNSVGGDGGAAGSGGSVKVTVNANIDTYGSLSHGVLAQSIGGGGGYGGFTAGANVSVKEDASTQGVGGDGGGGGKGLDVTVRVGTADAVGNPTIHTRGLGAVGVLAQSIGGGGGTGGFAGALSIAPDGKTENDVTGGSGGDGSSSGKVDVENYGTIITEKGNAAGILAQSIGGGGGNGGFSLAGAFESDGDGAKNSVGGDGGKGAVGGEVDVTNGGSITTSGDFSHGIFAQSVGGGGGNGGFSIDGTISDSGSGATSSVGGSGGAGGTGGAVTVTNTGTIDVTGKNSQGIFAQSVGGGGGSGGFAGAFDFGGGGVDNLVGGDGAAGGNGGDVTVTSTGSIHTAMANSTGVFAQSVGGSGGWAGLAIGVGDGGGDGSSGIKLGLGSKCDITGDDPCDILSLIPIDGSTGKVTVTINGVQNVTEGALSYGMLAQSIAGGGGAAATVVLDQLGFSGSDVVLSAGSDGSFGGNASFADNTYNTEHTSTTGVGAIGVIVQSVGGGGGVVGNVNNALVLNPTSPPDDGFYLTAGGISGGAGYNYSGSGGGFELDAAGTVSTGSANAIGVIGQTIGGGGGIVNLTVSSVTNEGDELAIVVGGNQKNTGVYKSDGGAASTLNADALVSTGGALSHGIVAQSIGGGGGVSDAVFENGVVLANGTHVTIGGGAGSAGGNGGDLTVNASGVTTTGAGAFGIVAQSIGGGGGLTGVYSGGTLLGQAGYSLSPVTITTGAGALGNGGVVTVNSNGDVRTEGYGAHGIVAQSIGGGGGIVGNGMFATALGSGAPFAGSVGGTGMAAAVNVTETRNVVVTGDESVGIFGQSAGGTSNGNVAIKVDQTGTNGNGVGLVWASRGSGAAVELADGNNNTLETNGTLYAEGSLLGAGLPDLGGMAVLGGAGNDVVTNRSRSPSGANDNQLVGGTRTSNIIGNIDLGAGSNGLINESGALLISDISVKLGAGNLFSNEGLLSPGDRGRIETTSLTGDFNQTASGAYYVDIDLAAQNTANPVNDLWDATGTGAFAGEGPLLLLSIDKAFSNTGYVIAHADGGMTDNGFTPTLTPQAVGFIFKTEVQNADDLVLLAEKPAFLDLLQDPASGTTDPNVWRMGAGIDNIEQAISVDDKFNYLINLLRLQPDAKALGDAVTTLTPHQAAHIYELTNRRADDFVDQTMTGCEDSFANSKTDGLFCLWGGSSGGRYDRNSIQDSPTIEDNSNSFQVGGKTQVNPNFDVGFGLGLSEVSSAVNRDGTALSSMNGNLYQASVSAAYQNNGFGLSFAAAGTLGTVETSRHVQVNGFEQTYSSFDGIATGVAGTGELPAFSDKTITFDGVNGYATSDAQIQSFDPRLRVSYGSAATDNGVQVTGMLDVDGHLMHTPAHTETGVGIASLTYPDMVQTAVTITPGLEVRASTKMDNGFVVSGFARGQLEWSPFTNEWVADTQFAAAPSGLPPIEIVEPFDNLRAKLNVGVMLACPGSGAQLTMNYAGTFGLSATMEHEVKGGLSFPIGANPGGC